MNNEDLEEQVNEIRATHVIMLKDNEQGTVRVKSSKEERYVCVYTLF